MNYYQQLARRCIECNKFDVPYRLSRELVMRGKDVEKDPLRQFVLDSCAFMSEFCQDRNPDAGAMERDCLGMECCEDWFGSGGGKDTSQEQFVLALCSMAASAQAPRPHVVTFLCFWLLLGPYWNLTEKIWWRKFCSNIYNHLAISLATFFVSPSVIFNCLEFAKKKFTPLLGNVPWLANECLPCTVSTPRSQPPLKSGLSECQW
jgi:hypothetical protein